MDNKKRPDDALEAELKQLLVKIGQEPISDEMRSLAARLQTLLDDRTTKKS
ncbi:MAG: hypothetical protein P1U72_06050 [Paracoccaceae bacterium]|nr:hypothetical protein [Paracoccaceae bacterium]